MIVTFVSKCIGSPMLAWLHATVQIRESLHEVPRVIKNVARGFTSLLENPA